MFGCPDVGVAGIGIEENETNVFYMFTRRQSFKDGANCNCCGFMHRIAEGPGRYRRKGNGLDSMVVGDADRFAITARERFGFTEGAPSIHGTNGVHHMLSWQAAAGGYDCFAGGQGTGFSYDALALLENPWGGGAVDGSVYASSAEE